MNIPFQNPHTPPHPTHTTSALQTSKTITLARYSPTAKHIATATSQAQILIFDCITNSLAMTLKRHVGRISAIHWTRRGKKLISGGTDYECIVWDLQTGQVESSVRMDGPVADVIGAPKNCNIFLACPQTSHAVLVDTTDKQHPMTQELEFTADTDAPTNTRMAESGCVACFNRAGDRILTIWKGIFSEYSTSTAKLIRTQKLDKGFTVRNMYLDRSGKLLVMNCSFDRSIRIYRYEPDQDISMLQKFRDQVNGTSWAQCAFSADGEYVIAGSAGKAQHKLYIWEVSMGNLIKILEGPQEGLEDFTWHPMLPQAASVTSYGTVNLWTTQVQETWSAFAPDFKELEENIVYEEREDEFDILPEDLTKNKEMEEEVLIDVTTVEPIKLFYNDHDSDVEAMWDCWRPAVFPGTLRKDDDEDSGED